MRVRYRDDLFLVPTPTSEFIAPTYSIKARVIGYSAAFKLISFHELWSSLTATMQEMRKNDNLEDFVLLAP